MTSTLTAEQSELLDLRDRVYDLEQELRQLRASIRLETNGWVLPLAWGLSRAEQGVLLTIARAGSVISQERIHTTLRAAGTSRSNDPHSVDVHVCRIRRKLADAGIPVVVENRHGAGYLLSAESAKFVLYSVTEVVA